MVREGGGSEEGGRVCKISKALTLPYTMQRKKALKRKSIVFSCNFKYGIDTYKCNLL